MLVSLPSTTGLLCELEDASRDAVPAEGVTAKEGIPLRLAGAATRSTPARSDATGEGGGGCRGFSCPPKYLEGPAPI